MDPTAVAHAGARLAKAEKALIAFKSATSIANAEEAWTDFLVAVSTIYSKLEQGAKGYGRSAPWFGTKKRERKDDPLLRYLHFARNSDEHGIERVAEVTGSTFNYLNNKPMAFNERMPVSFQMVNEKTGQTEGAIHQGVISGPTLKPVRANDHRFHDFCDPPKEHMGRPIPYSDFVDGLATAALPYLRGMISEAEELAASHSNDIAR